MALKRSLSETEDDFENERIQNEDSSTLCQDIAASKKNNVKKKEPIFCSRENVTIVDVLQQNATLMPDKCMLRWVNSKCQVTKTLTYCDLWKRSGAVLDLLRKNGVTQGDRVMIAYPFGLSFLEGIFGCFRAGVIACSVYPPNPKKDKAQHSFKNFNAQVKDAGAKYALTTTRFEMIMKATSVFGCHSSVKWLATDSLKASPEKEESHDESGLLPENIAFIQYTSGSTGSPKGVMISHGAIMHNLQTIEAVSVLGTASVMGVSWLPQYHDYGLINFYLGPVYSTDFPCVTCSPIDFIQSPLLWADMLEKFDGTHTAGPNFAYGLLAKRMKAGNRVLKNSKIVRANIAAEPISPNTLQAMAAIGIPNAAINPCYGMAESCVYITSCIGNEVNVVDGVVSCGLLERSEAFGIHVVVVEPEHSTIVKDGTVGEIHVSSPSLASGYWAKPDLNQQCFGICFYGKFFFATGDLGKIVSGHLYVLGRSKELIIVNGRNVYPTDLERTIEDAYPTIVRPGSTVAYQHTSVGAGLVLEMRSSALSQADSSSLPTENKLRSLIQEAHEVNIVSIYVLKQGSVPKTTSGKLRRYETKRRSTEKEWQRNAIIWNFKYGAEISDLCPYDFEHAKEASTPQQNNIQNISEDLPTNHIPRVALDSVRSIKANKKKLDAYFIELQLDGVPGVLEAWKSADKSTNAMQAMCETSMQALTEHYPTVVEFLHLLQTQKDWILDDSASQLTEIVHCSFVLNWVTQKLAANVELLQAKLDIDNKCEQTLLEGHEPIAVPKDSQFLVGGQTNDPLFGLMDAFHWMKHRSIDNITRELARTLHGKKGSGHIDNEGCDWAMLNVLEATWLDYVSGRRDNTSVGQWLVSRSQHAIEMDDNIACVDFQHPLWTRVYLVWNLAIMTSFRSPEWVLSKLLMPCVANAPPRHFYMYRVISLYLTSQKRLHQHMTGVPLPKIFSSLATQAFGILNKRWVFRQNFDKNLDWDASSNPEAAPAYTGMWFKRFESWSSFKTQKAPSAVQPGSVSFDAILNRHFGNKIDSEQSWDGLGLSSLASVELKNAISDSLSVPLPPNCFELYPTPAALKSFVAKTEGKRFPIKLDELPKLESKEVSWFILGLLQGLAVGILLFFFAACFIPAYYVGKLVTADATSSLFIIDGHLFRWTWFPFAIPAWMVSFSMIIVILKWIVIGRYQACEMPVPSLAYIKWWWVDRALHVWEFWVGTFIKDTPFLWLFYRLLGAQIHVSVKLDAFIREFDLVKAGEGARVECQIRCRKFVARNEGQGPTLWFRPVSLEKHCVVKGMTCPGVSLGEGSVVEKLSVVVEGARVPARVIASGNPAISAGPAPQPCVASWWTFGVIKIIWLLAELYIIFCLILVAHILVYKSLPLGWKYAPFFHWFLLISIQAILSVAMSIVFKWVFIGRHQPGPCAVNIWKIAAEWIVDYHFTICMVLPLSVSSRSKTWNLILMLHGMDVDFASTFDPEPDIFPPSKMDLISIKRSFVTTATFETSNGGSYHRIKIIDSSIGYHANICAGTSVVRATVPPATNVTESTIGEPSGTRSSLPTPTSSSFWRLAISLDIFYLAIISILAISFLPSFELWVTVFKPSSVEVAVPVIALLTVVQTSSFSFVLFLLQLVAHGGSKKRVSPKSYPFYMVFVNVASAIQSWSFLHVLWGTPLMAVVLRLLGATVGSHVLYFGKKVFDLPYITFLDETIVDNAVLTGHYMVYDETSLAPVRVSGVIHDNTWVANTTICTSESGPWRGIIGTVQSDGCNDVSVNTQNSFRQPPLL